MHHYKEDTRRVWPDSCAGPIFERLKKCITETIPLSGSVAICMPPVPVCDVQVFGVEWVAIKKISSIMAKIGSGKWAGWAAIMVLSHLLSVNAQPGFLSVDCGGKSDYTDENNIAWVPDANYIDIGQTANTGNTELPFYLQSLRFFPKPLNKSCYQLRVEPQVPYLLRLWFVLGNYTGIPQLSNSFVFSIETPGLLTEKNLAINHINTLPAERIFVSDGTVLCICLIRTSEIDDPFINAIELRTLRNGMYSQAKPGRMLRLHSRYSVGGNSSVRYPQDNFDRIWVPSTDLHMIGGSINTVSLPVAISTNSTQDLPPAIVMQKAWEPINDSISLDITGGEGTNSLMLLYFAETEELNMTGGRSFEVLINGQRELPEPITIVQKYSASEVQLQLNVTNYDLVLVKAPNSIYGPLLNAFENYVFADTDMATYREDVEVLEGIKTKFNIKSWISDPCYLVVWDGIGCDKSSPARRISEINLSGMNLTGPIPQNIGQLTALLSLSLANNHLMGPLPNLSNLTMLERLNLQNNSLGGALPLWLAGLENLAELFIDNNNFSGVIPAQLLKPSLSFRYIGNRYLYLPSNSNKNRLTLLLGITISGSLAVIVLMLIVGVIMHRRKSKSKGSSIMEKESKHAVEEDNSKIIMSNSTKSHAFTVEEIMTATKNFSQKIGQGGFGSVYFGTLEQGTDIAVKVLSLFSKQGVQEFLNEVDLLSRVHHKKLVSLLGYCNESREPMLVYEHMSGGSLRDHLYGPTAELSQLNWKTRLKIASDAAQGLEYLHVGCTPKVIHRDIKTANILLDRNFNGKLADFGLSKMTIDEEASHITTTVKGTFGYLDPDYFSTQMLTEKSDVYSFGVVLLEIICGRQPIDTKLRGEEVNLIRWVTPYVEMDENRGKIAEIIDKKLGINYDIKSITGVAKLAIRCVHSEPSARPHVSEVVAELKDAIKVEEHETSLMSRSSRTLSKLRSIRLL